MPQSSRHPASRSAKSCSVHRSQRPDGFLQLVATGRCSCREALFQLEPCRINLENKVAKCMLGMLVDRNLALAASGQSIKQAAFDQCVRFGVSEDNSALIVCAPSVIAWF